MQELESAMRDLETKIWECAKTKDKDGFLKLLGKDAVMVCGGYRCTGDEYAGFISDFDTASYEFLKFEIVAKSEDFCQIHYVIRTEVSDSQNADLAGLFHITSTWEKENDEWKLVFNMDSRIIEA